ncbi:MAG: polysaccharide biosynthesis/export family protein [Nitrospiraceae bacterium]
MMLVAMMGLWAGCASSISPDALLAQAEGRTGAGKGGTGPGGALAEPKEIIEPGDGLEILVQRVAGEEKFTAPVRANGIITVAFVDIDVKGLTEDEAEARITEELTEVIRSPRVLVRITQKGPTRVRNFYVLGEVRNAGKFPMARRMTLLQAIGQGGGHTEVADLEKVIVISRQGETPQIRLANLRSVLVNGEMAADFLVADEDVIFIPRSGIGDFNFYYTKVVNPILTTVVGVVNGVFIGKALEVLFRTPVQTSVAVPCWVASVLYGEHAWQTHVLRWYVSGPLRQSNGGRVFAGVYLRYGQQAARFLKRHPSAQVVVKPLFDYLLRQAVRAVDDTREASSRRAPQA